MLEDLMPPTRQFACRVRTVISELDGKDVKILVEALDNPVVWPAKTLSRALKDRGVVLSDTSISNHRKKSCSC